jgi:hypothetical protein
MTSPGFSSRCDGGRRTWCLTVATNAIFTCTTKYYGLAVTALRPAGRAVDDEVVAAARMVSAVTRFALGCERIARTAIFVDLAAAGGIE